MKNLKKEYRDLETKVLSLLRQAILKSNFKSKHIETNAIQVKVSDYDELVIVNDNLTFLDSYGNYYSVFYDCTLEDLIDIVHLVYKIN